MYYIIFKQLIVFWPTILTVSLMEKDSDNNHCFTDSDSCSNSSLPKTSRLNAYTKII